MTFRKPVHSLPPDLGSAPLEPPSPLHPPEPSPVVPPCVDAVLAASIELLCASSVATDDPLAAELLGSDAAGIWWMPSCAYGAPGADFERRIGYAYASALDVRGGPDALAALRALQVGAAPGIAAAVAPTAERLSGRGIAEPPWWSRVSGLRALRAVEISGPDDGHRTRIVFVEVERRGLRMTLGVLTDANAAGVAASIGVFDELDSIRDALGAEVPEHALEDMIRPLAVEEARCLVLRSIERTDLLGTVDRHGPGFVGYRGLALQWLATVAPEPGAQAA